MENQNIPRRARIDQMSKGELAIREAVMAVEEMGASTLLTEAVILLGSAQEKVADFVDRAIAIPGEMNWSTAEAHLKQVVEAYRELVGMPGVIVGPTLTLVIDPLVNRHHRGERTRELYDSIMGLKL